jgi:hypothetical protein
MASKEEARLRARVAGGSLSRALAVDWEDYQEYRKAMLRVLNALTLTGDRSRLLEIAEQMNDARHKDQYEFSLDILEALIRDALALTVGLAREKLVNEDLALELTRVGQQIDSSRAVKWILQIEELREQLVVNINRKPATDALFLSMAAA